MCSIARYHAWMMQHINSPLQTTAPRLFRVNADRPLAMLRLCPAYEATPLHSLSGLAAELGIDTLWAKDETQRMRLGSFKALGGAFAVAQMISDAAGVADLTSPKARDTAGAMTFITASAGNHGLSVAAGARVFGSRAVIVLSSSVPEDFANRIRALDAEVVRVDGTYEASVAYAIEEADAKGWLLLADGSWEGYIDRPALVMEGYSVLAEECRTAFANDGSWPTHVFLQAGVGGLAAAVAGHIREFWDEQPTIVVVEPEAAPCLMESVKAGCLTRADGPLSNMGRLDCKDASLISFESLRRDADRFVTVTDAAALAAVKTLADHGVATTPSGAAPLAAIQEFAPGMDSRCLLIVSEGSTGGE
ncbi:diaminopropionate ammonia-lyase [Pelagibius sp. Alg239-R121]|uniref:diaminopropionate ammonia-lyase n=1 Tax=Pelagibius sp. Alg239-R121 TaxID=2993448 RepID=UPI0024A73CDB|nr:diaminopropionate ammonia-lyase [Pelagibius sp. Alg239-R121]